MVRIVKSPEDRKTEIIVAATKLFLEHDYDKTTMEDITKQLGIAKGTIYHYFSSKEALLDAVVEHMVHGYIEEMRPALDRTKGNALERMQGFLSADRALVNDQKETLHKLHSTGNVALHTRQLAVLFSKMAPLIAQVIEAGCKEGFFKTDYPLESAELLLSGIQFLTDVGVYPWKAEDLMRRSKAIPALVEAQLGAAKGSFNFLLKKKDHA